MKIVYTIIYEGDKNEKKNIAYVGNSGMRLNEYHL